MPRVLTYTEGNTAAPVLVRGWRSGGVLRPWYAGRDATRNPGSPNGSCRKWTPETVKEWDTGGVMNPETA
jgi:hypothetical protein